MNTDYSWIHQWIKYLPPEEPKKAKSPDDKTLPDDVVKKQVIAPHFHSGKKAKAKL
jgi:hypothetical protein